MDQSQSNKINFTQQVGHPLSILTTKVQPENQYAEENWLS